MSLFGAITGTDQIAAAAKSGKKAAKKQEATANQQLGASTDLHNQQLQTLSGIVPQQQAYLQNAANQEQAAYSPYQQYGQQGMNALQGYYGNDPAQAQAMLQNFQNSPLYQSQYQNALGAATQGLERNMGANGMLNSGRTLKGLQDRAGAITNQLFGQYVGQANNAIGMGGQMAARAGGAYGQLGANQANALGSYGSNVLSAGNQYGSNMGSAYGNVLNAQGAFGSAAAAGHMGQANTMQGLWSGAAGLAGNALGGGGMVGGPVGSWLGNQSWNSRG